MSLPLIFHICGIQNYHHKIQSLSCWNRTRSRQCPLFFWIYRDLRFRAVIDLLLTYE